MSDPRIVVFVDLADGDVIFKIMQLKVYDWYETLKSENNENIESIIDIIDIDSERLEELLDDIHASPDLIPEEFFLEEFGNILELFEYVDEYNLRVVNYVNIYSY